MGSMSNTPTHDIFGPLPQGKILEPQPVSNPVARRTWFDQFIDDIYVTASIGYWSETLEHVPGDNWHTEIKDEDGNRWTINQEVVERGYDRCFAGSNWLIIEDTTGQGNDRIVARFVNSEHPYCGHCWTSGQLPPSPDGPSDQGWDFDASDADAIVQVGLFGRVIFG